MGFLKCKVCRRIGLEVIGHPLAVFKKVKCLGCGFSNERKKEVEIEVINRRNSKEEA